MVCISGKSFLNEGLADGRLGDSTNDELLESSVRVMLMYMVGRGHGRYHVD